MDGYADHLEQELEIYQRLRGSLPSSWTAFFARFGRLRPIQLAAIPTVLAGKHVLLTAPTAGGKTEAVVGPVCERLASEKWTGLSCILVTPTRALVNDLFERLERPLAEMGIVLGRKTSDHAMSDRLKAQFLITTPESLESLLTFRRERLRDVRTIIIDEVHLLDGTPRGDQLRMVIQRLKLFLSQVPGRVIPLQMIALSATLPNARITAERFLGANPEIVSVAGQRLIDSVVVVVDGDDQARALEAVHAAEAFDDVRKMLVFYNSRKKVDATGQFFKTGRFVNAAVHCHHGSLSKGERERSEQRFKQDQFAICVATMTLEIGIDIGDVDLVVCMSPPSGISSFLQRIGRGCRRLQGRTRVLCVARDRAEELIFKAMIGAAIRPIPESPAIPFRRTVLVQQVLAYLRQVDKHRRVFDQIKRALTNAVSPPITDVMLQAVLVDMRAADLIAERNGIYEPAARGWEFIQSSRIYANIGSPIVGVQIVDVETGKLVSTVKEILPDFRNSIRVGGRSFQVVGTQGSKVTVRGANDSTTPPDYDSISFPYAYDVSVAVAESLGCGCNKLEIVASNDYVFVMTWLGKLQNVLLAAVLKKQGINALGLCFSLRIPMANASSLQGLLQQAVKKAVVSNEIEELVVERFADLGPYLEELSVDGQKECRRDWLDKVFLERWISDATQIELVDPSNPRVTDLLSLAMVK